MGTLVLFDGTCGLCERSVQFILKRDRRDRFVFAPLQSGASAQVLARHGTTPLAENTFYAVAEYGTPAERLLRKARAALHVLRRIGGGWTLLTVFGVLPTALLDWFYDRVARNRMRFFGRVEQCRIPTERDRKKFIETP